jgi:asparagine synthase (glutamine-hydrolysing)
MKKFFSGKDKLMSLFKSKIALRKILYEILPKNLIDRKKTGFNPPMDDLIRKIGEKKCLEYLQTNKLFLYCDKNFVCDLLKDHFRGSKNNTYKIFQLLFISAWLKINTQK